jgi:hypothetical protein
LSSCVTKDAAGPAGVGRGDDCCEVADADAAFEHMPRYGRADKCRGDIVEEAGHDEHKDQKHEAAGPIVRQSHRHPVRDAACLEMACEESKTEQQQKQVREKNPFKPEMSIEACQPCAFGEAVTQKLLDRDGT